MVPLDAFAGALPDLKEYIASIRRGTLSLHTEQTSQLAEILGTFLEAESTKQQTVGALSSAVSQLAGIIGSGSSSTAAWGARNFCHRVQALLVEEAGKAATGTAEGDKGVSLASVESRVAALALVGDGQGTGAQGGMELPFSGSLREAVLEGLAELQGETEMQTIIEGMAPALKDVFRPGDAVFVALGCAGLPPAPAPLSSQASPASAIAAGTEILVGVLEAAAEPDVKRPFEVFVQEGGPGCIGRALAVRLASPSSASASGAGAEAALARKAISTVLVADGSVVPILPRVTKVLVPAFAVSSAGDAVVPAGVVPVVVAARAAGKPVIVVATSLHLCPEQTGQQLGLPASLTAVGSQSAGLLLRATTPTPAPGGDITVAGAGEVVVVAPLREVLPASFITAYLLDTGLTTAAGVKQLARENYGHTAAAP